MENSAVGFAPGHISGYFKRIDGTSTQTTGSLGAGVVIDKGVYVKMTPSSKTAVKLNGKIIDSPLVCDVLDPFEKTANVEITAEMPIGAGFGMSAACLLASFISADALFDLGLCKDEIFARSHDIEVRRGTGLGDVAAISSGGIVVRTEPGIHGVTDKFFDERNIYCLSFGEIVTQSVINSEEKMRTVNNAFPLSIPKNGDEFMENSRTFARNAGLLASKPAEIIESCEKEGVICSMTMLGCGVFAFGEKAKEIFEQYAKPIKLKVSKTGPRLIKIVEH